MSRWHWQMGLWRIATSLLLSAAVISCGRSKEEPSVSRPSSPTPASGTEQSRGADAGASVTPALPSSGSVIIGKSLGVSVTGSGAGTPGRSVDALEQQLLSFILQVQGIYNRELVQEPGMMGTLDVKMTIEPGGTVSDLRFPFKRVSSEKLTAAAYDQIRSWIFPPAEARVDLYYRMVFVPSGLDQVSIIKWESLLGDRVMTEQQDAPPPPVVAATPLPAASTRSPASVAQPKQPGEGPAGGKSPDEPEGESTARFVASWYRVTRPTSLYAAPRESAAVVTQLRPGKRIWVVGVVGNDWFEVHSMTGRAPGFLSRDSARPERLARARP